LPSKLPIDASYHGSSGSKRFGEDVELMKTVTKEYIGNIETVGDANNSYN